MEYSILADAYEKLESRSGKIEKAKIVSDLMERTSVELLSKVVLLVNGTVFPSWSEEELGVAGQLIAKAIAKSYGLRVDDVVKNFKKTGDFGKTWRTSLEEKAVDTPQQERPTVEKVFDNMRLVAGQSSGGSQDRKISLITELLSNAKPKEAKYIVRTVLGELRIGVAEGIIRDAIAEAFGVQAEDVENAWFLNPDYGEIARIAKEKGTEGLRKVRLQLGKPVMVQLAEKAPSLKEAVESFKEVALDTSTTAQGF
jgi:DNA ligase-1